MQLECSGQRFAEPLDADRRFGLFHAAPRAVPAVHRTVGVEKEGGERQIVVKLEQRKVQVVGFDDTDADELFEELLDAGVETSDLLVEFMARFSRHTAEHDQERLAALAGRVEGVFEIVIDPVRIFGELAAIVLHSLLAVFCIGRRDQAREYQKHTEPSCDASSHSEPFQRLS